VPPSAHQYFDLFFLGIGSRPKEEGELGEKASEARKRKRDERQEKKKKLKIKEKQKQVRIVCPVFLFGFILEY